ncbi:uncharacterized protein VTP21DRAFT_5707 [Calcarisporiella thermophila]|uniref:uncharacterized protein n=1 Tax=Calcarisporiella thermophila TaxID=911321 RepID=UPI003744591B
MSDSDSATIKSPVSNIDGKEAGEEGVVLQKANASTWSAYINVVCVLAGAGTLGMPYALKVSGWVGLVLLALATVMSIYGNHILIKCLYYDGKTRLREFPDIGHAAFGWIGRAAVFIFYNSILLGGPTLYLILSGQNIKLLVDPLGVNISLVGWICICAAVMAVPFTIMKTMREVAFMSIFGALATFITVFIVVGVSLKHLPDLPPQPTKPYDAPQLPLTLATFAFSYGGNVTFPHIEESMRNKKAWPRVITLSILSVALIYFLCSVVGYYVYGDTVKSPVYLSNPDGPAKVISIIIITVHVLLAIPLFLTSFALQIEAIFNIASPPRTRVVEFGLRAIVRIASMALAAAIACIVPHFNDVMALLGGFSDAMLTFVLPVAFYIKLFGWRSINKLELVWCIIVLVIGLIVTVFGTIDAIENLYKDFHGLK